MRIQKNKNYRRYAYVLLLTLISISAVLSGCASEKAESQPPNTSSETTTPTESTTDQSTSTTNPNSDTEESNKEGLPEGVTVKKIIKDETINNGYHKKVELLTDGGKRKTITDPNGKTVTKYIEYEGIILKAEGNKVEVQVKQGGTQTFNIPKDVVIEDEDQLGLKQGVEIELEINTDGRIQSVELDD